jgi:Protein of unknown function (DUF3126)
LTGQAKFCLARRKAAGGSPVKPEELKKLTNFLRKRFRTPTIEVRRRPQKSDSAEVYLGEEFIGVMYRDEEDGELSYHFEMSILDFDLEE